MLPVQLIIAVQVREQERVFHFCRLARAGSVRQGKKTRVTSLKDSYVSHFVLAGCLFES